MDNISQNTQIILNNGKLHYSDRYWMAIFYYILYGKALEPTYLLTLLCYEASNFTAL